MIERNQPVSFELHGQLNQSLQMGSDGASAFALMLAMAEQNPVFQLKIKDAEPDKAPQALFNPYPQQPLSAEKHDWQNLREYRRAMTDSPLSMKLWRAFRPEPLSQFNNAKHIDPIVLDNCDLDVKKRYYQHEWKRELEVDETALLDILDDIHQNRAVPNSL